MNINVNGVNKTLIAESRVTYHAVAVIYRIQPSYLCREDGAMCCIYEVAQRDGDALLAARQMFPR